MRKVQEGKLASLRQWLATHKKQLLFGVPVGILGLFILVQLVYPGGRLLPLQKIDETSYGFATKDKAIAALDKKYAATKLDLYFGEAKKTQYTPKLSQIGLKVDNTKRVEDLRYHWYWRLVPTSIFWAQATMEPAVPTYTRTEKTLAKYLKTTLDGSCSVAPQNATAKVKKDKVVVVPEEDGGVCKESEVRTALSSVKPVLPKQPAVRVKVDPRPAALKAADVSGVVETINKQLDQGVTLSHADTTLDIEQGTVASWLTFSTDNDQFTPTLDPEKTDAYIREHFEKQVNRPAGTTKIVTRDFVETSRQEGEPGRQLDLGGTRTQLLDYLLAKGEAPSVAEAPLPAKVEYTRSYSNSDTGLSALMEHYAESHPGTYGVSMIELDGKRRRASFNDSHKFTTASTYKLYVGFSALKRVESGEYKWSDQISNGRNLQQCFDDMIVKSDNPCAEALVAKIGYRPLTTEAQTIVSGNTTFLDTESYKTTAGDLSTFMASLATGQIALNSELRATFLDALKRNQYRQGIPAGANGQVADKVGFLEGFLHDTAIVYGPSGTYALSIMTDGSSWANIAELTREIEKLKAQ